MVHSPSNQPNLPNRQLFQYSRAAKPPRVTTAISGTFSFRARSARASATRRKRRPEGPRRLVSVEMQRPAPPKMKRGNCSAPRPQVSFQSAVRARLTLFLVLVPRRPCTSPPPPPPPPKTTTAAAAPTRPAATVTHPKTRQGTQVRRDSVEFGVRWASELNAASVIAHLTRNSTWSAAKFTHKTRGVPRRQLGTQPPWDSRWAPGIPDGVGARAAGAVSRTPRSPRSVSWTLPLRRSLVPHPRAAQAPSSYSSLWRAITSQVGSVA